MRVSAAALGGADLGQRLRRGDDFDDAAVLQPQSVAGTQHHRLGKVEQEAQARARRSWRSGGGSARRSRAPPHQAGSPSPQTGGKDGMGVKHGASKRTVGLWAVGLYASAATAFCLWPSAQTQRQPACEPVYVSLTALRLSGVTAIPLGRPSPDASSNQPERPGLRTGPACLAAPRVAPIRFCSRRGLPCRRRCRRRGALLPHPFTLADRKAGGLLSVALSLGSPPPDVIRRRVAWSPDFPPPEGDGRPADWREGRCAAGGEVKPRRCQRTPTRLNKSKAVAARIV